MTTTEIQLAADVHALRFAVQHLYALFALLAQKDAAWLTQERDSLINDVMQQPVFIAGVPTEAQSETVERARALFTDMFDQIRAPVR